jgi:hypothetical protein
MVNYCLLVLAALPCKTLHIPSNIALTICFDSRQTLEDLDFLIPPYQKFWRQYHLTKRGCYFPGPAWRNPGKPLFMQP